MRPSARRLEIAILSYNAFAWSAQSAETQQNALQRTDIVQITVVFLSFASKTNARSRQDLHDSKQDRFCPQVPLQSTQNYNSSQGL